MYTIKELAEKTGTIPNAIRFLRNRTITHKYDFVLGIML